MLSKKAFLALTALFTLLIINSSNAQQNSRCVAVITGISGDVFLRKVNDKEFARASWGTQLYSGDQVKTSDNSGTTLAFSNNSIVKLAQNSQITVSGEGSKAENTGEIVNNVSTGIMIDLSETISKKEYAKEEGAMAGLRSTGTENPIVLFSPVNTQIKTLRPSFSWSAKGSFSNYIVTLYKSQGSVWTRKITGNSLNFPENEKELENGVSYFWNVEVEAPAESEKSEIKKFSVISLEKSKEVAEQEKMISEAFRNEQENSSLHSLLGAYYIKQGLFQDALKEFQEVCEMNPEAPMPHEILGSLYTRIGNKDKAIEELQKALALSQKK
jgi:tetratricopeptide (TPR) repeat protein